MKDGGPAFPAIEYMVERGMSLRDYFAAAALQGMLASRRDQPFSAIANECYIAASAMIAERENS